MDIHKNARTTSHNRMLMVHRLAQGDRTGQSNRRAGGRGLGWEFLHVAIDDNSRLAYTEVLPNERKESAIAFTGRAVAGHADASTISNRMGQRPWKRHEGSPWR